MNIIETTAYLCGECRKHAYLSRDKAENCCKPELPNTCPDCGAEIKKYYTICAACLDKRRYEKAEKLTEWDGWVYWDGHGLDDGYFSDLGNLLDYCEDEGIDPPKWVYVCKSMRHELNIESAIENMLDDAFEDAREYLVDEKGLHDFVDEWNKQQNIISYYPDYTRVLLLKGGDPAC